MEVTRHKWRNILLLILAGEAIFLLPFVLVRIFRPTFLKVLEVSNTELGWCFSAYGFVALASYFLGGLIADRMAPEKLIGSALIATSFGGFYLGTIPTPQALIILYSYWGVTTILLFWAPLIKATRAWGSNKNQGMAFGLLDGGRGAVAALIGFLGILLFSSPSENETLSDAERLASFQRIVWTTSAIVFSAGILVFILLRSGKASENETKSNRSNPFLLLKETRIWLLMIIVLTAYVGYKITDFFPLYGTEVMKMDEITAGKMGTALMICRPITAITIGLIADRFVKSKVLGIFFVLMVIEGALFASGIISKELTIVFTFNMLLTGIAIYGARALYFSLIEEGKFSLNKTGQVVGFVSIIGFTPDIFVGPTSGYFLDNYPGIAGFQFIFAGLFLCAILGALASYFFSTGSRRKTKESKPRDQI